MLGDVMRQWWIIYIMEATIMIRITTNGTRASGTRACTTRFSRDIRDVTHQGGE